MSHSARPIRRMWDHIAHPRRRRHGGRLILALLVLVISSLPLQRGTISSAEEAIFSAINGWPDWLGWLLIPIMQLGTVPAVVLAALVGVFVFRRGRLGVDFGVAGMVTWVLARLVKTTVERGRPLEFLDVVIIRGAPASGYGFVSGHTAVAAALATVAAAYLGARGKIVVALLAGLVGVARMFVGAHLPLDVVGGAAMGWAVGSLVHFLVLPEIMGDDEEEPASSS